MAVEFYVAWGADIGLAGVDVDAELVLDRVMARLLEDQGLVTPTHMLDLNAHRVTFSMHLLAADAADARRRVAAGLWHGITGTGGLVDLDKDPQLVRPVEPHESRVATDESAARR